MLLEVNFYIKFKLLYLCVSNCFNDKNVDKTASIFNNVITFICIHHMSHITDVFHDKHTHNY